MLANPGAGDGGGEANSAYKLIGAVRTSRVQSDNTVQDVVQWTAQSQLYFVTFTKFAQPVNWNLEARDAIIQPVVRDVNEVCSHDHVIGFRTVQDFDASRLLINYAVITVGSEDGQYQDDVTVRMDQVNTGATFGAIDKTWAVLVAAGAK